LVIAAACAAKLCDQFTSDVGILGSLPKTNWYGLNPFFLMCELMPWQIFARARPMGCPLG
jgi:hypothetical protein